jgi:hypothetical protein
LAFMAGASTLSMKGIYQLRAAQAMLWGLIG